MRSWLLTLLATMTMFSWGEDASMSAASTAHTAIPDYELDNGLRVVLLKDDSQPFVAVAVGYDVGGKDEGPGKWGLSHVVEHIYYQGTLHIPKETHDRALIAAGGSGDGWTGFDRTIYYSMAPANSLETILWLNSDRMGFLAPALREELLAKEKAVVHNERRTKIENPPLGPTNHAVTQTLFPAPHPYHGAVYGSHEDIDGVSMEKVEAFLAQYYSPSNAVLVVVGSFDPVAARASIEKYFGPIPGSKKRTTGAAGPELLPQAGSERKLTMRAAVPSTRLTFAWRGPPMHSAGDAELDLLAQILADGERGLLWTSLVDDLALASHVSCRLQGLQLGSIFRCDIDLAPGASAEGARDAFLAALRQVERDGVADDDLRAIKVRNRAGSLRAVESVMNRARIVCAYTLATGDPAYLEKELAIYEQVSSASIGRQSSKWLPESRMLTVVTVPEE